MKKWLGRRWKKALLVAAVAVALFGGWLWYEVLTIARTAENRVFDELQAVPYNRVGLLLGCAPRLADGRVNLYFARRLRAAVELYNSGKIEYVLVSGDNGAVQYDEPTAFKRALTAAGVPTEKIVLDYAGFRTLDSVVRAKEVFGLTEFTVVSQRFHNQRAVYLASQFGIVAVGYNAEDVGGPEGFKVRVREWGARIKAVLDVKLLGTRPKYLGRPIRIGAAER